MKNYNIFALRGDTETSDVDVCRTLGLPMELAGTPALNKAAIDKMYKENVQSYIAKGIPEAQAYAQAGELRNNVEREIRELSKE
jgi:hypothetical protein